MKKILLCVSLLSMFAAGFVGCSQKREWNHEQRKAMREALRSYRQMVYLDDLTDAEFVLFTDQVAGRHLSRLRNLRGDAGRNRHG